MAGLRPGVRWLLRLALSREYLTRADVDREIAFHIDARTARLMGAGMSAQEARAEALRRFGDVEQARALLLSGALQQESQTVARERLETFVDDIRYVLRGLLRSRAFSAAVIVALGLGIGANAAMFGIVDRLMLRGPDHVRDAKRLLRLYYTTADVHGKQGTFPYYGYVTYALLRDNARTLNGVAAYSDVGRTLGTGAQSERVEGYMVTRDFFALLGARPAAGRFFSPEEDLPPTGQNVVVLGYGLWQRQFGGDSRAVGSTVLLSGTPFRVVGVAPRGFTGVNLQGADIWLPMALSRTREDWPTTWQAQWLQIVARVKPGIPTEQAAAEAQALYRRNYGGRNQVQAKASMSLRPIAFTDAGREPREYAVSRWLAGVSIVVLLIACANVANLMIARAMRRRREVAVRLALGISRWRLARLLSLEGLVLALMGCVLGLVLAHWGGLVMRSVFLPDVAWETMPVNPRVIGLSVALAVVSGTLVGLSPVLLARRLDLNAALKSGSQQSGTSRSTTRPALVFAQAALAVLLLVGAGLFIRSVYRVTTLDLGFEPHRALRATIGWPPNAESRDFDAERARERAAFANVVDRLRATPGVENAAIAVGTPFGFAFGVDLWVPGRDSLPELEGGGPYVNAVSHGYFEATGMRLRRGRVFTSADNATSERVVVINETMARVLWPAEDPLSKCLQIFSKQLPCARVVGVVEDPRRNGLTEAPAMQYWVPYGQERSIGGSALVVRPMAKPEVFVPTLRRVVLAAEPNVLSIRTETLQEVIDPLTRSWRLGATIFTIFGSLALVIAAMGLYSVVAYLVAERTQEFGVRMALGARAADIIGLVMRRAFVTVVSGLVVGLVVALLAGPYVQSMLFQTSPRDTLVFAVATLTLLVAAALACALPALRAARVDAAVALRTE